MESDMDEPVGGSDVGVPDHRPPPRRYSALKVATPASRNVSHRVPGMREIIFRAPKATVDIQQNGVRAVGLRQTYFERIG
jgi:hypothetical protein